MTQLRPYQQELLEQMTAKLHIDNKVILAAATGAGKTEIIIKFIKNNPDLRFLILPHGQKIIRENFAERLKLREVTSFEIQASQDVSTSNFYNVVTALPQSVHKNLPLMENFDFIIVDEAHQFYGEDKRMYSKILDWHKGQFILTTASHYGLDGEKVFFSRQQALENNACTNFSVALVEVGESKIDSKEFSGAGDLSASLDLTEATYKGIMTLLTKKKTMIVCHNTAFADELAKRIKAKVSHCYDDVDSDNLNDFKKGKIKTIIVVARGNIGFDDPDLEHIIDASYTKNIIRMEQLSGRLSRLSKTVKTKLYTKLIPDEMFDQYLLYITGVLELGRTQTYETWDGVKNNLKVRVPSDGVMNPVAMVDSITVGEFRVNTRFKTDFSGALSLWDEGSEITIGAALAKLNGIGPEVNKQLILDWCFKHKRRPSGHSKDTEEKRLGGTMSGYVSPSSRSFDLIFKAKMDKLYPSVKNPEGNKQLILDWSFKNGRRPSQVSKDTEEKRLGKLLLSYTVPSNTSFDLIFKAKMDKLYPSRRGPEVNKQLILDWCFKHGRRPSQKSKDTEEKRLGKLMSKYVSPSNTSFDLIFKAKMDKLYPSAKNPEGNKQLILDWSFKNGRRPSQVSKDTEEKRLGKLMSKYVSPSSTMLDSIFKAKMDKLYPSRRGPEVRCVETSEVFPSAQAASLSLGLSKSAVCRALRSANKTTGGFHWERC